MMKACCFENVVPLVCSKRDSNFNKIKILLAHVFLSQLSCAFNVFRCE